MQRITVDAEFKFLEAGEHGSFTGYASTFENWDSVGERPVKGAFVKSLQEFLQDGFIAIGHDWYKLPIAMPTAAVEDEKGLLLTADFHSTTQAQEARTVMAERAAKGKSNKLSIGYRVLKDRVLAQGRELLEIKLLEVSLVTIPANNQASVLGVKGLTLDTHTEALVAELKHWQERMTAIAQLRAEAKRGATFSSVNMERMKSIRAGLSSLIDELEQLIALGENPKGRTPEQLKHDLAMIQIRIQQLELI